MIPIKIDFCKPSRGESLVDRVAPATKPIMTPPNMKPNSRVETPKSSWRANVAEAKKVNSAPPAKREGNAYAKNWRCRHILWYRFAKLLKFNDCAVLVVGLVSERSSATRIT